MNRFKGVRGRLQLKMAMTTKALTITANGAVTMLMMEVIRFMILRWEARSVEGWIRKMLTERNVGRNIGVHFELRLNKTSLLFASERIYS